MENVLSIVAAKPRYHPEMPSCRKMSSRTESIVSSSLRFPLAVDDVACMRVLALQGRGQLCRAWSYDLSHTRRVGTLCCGIISERTGD